MSRRLAWTNFHSKMLCLTCMTLGVVQLRAQILHATGPLPSFEVATIKPSADGKAAPSINTPTESRTTNVTARNLIEHAYHIPWTPGLNERVVGGPDWIDSVHYDVEARIDQSLVAAFATMSNEQQKDQTSLMMQSLLADRFKLRVHFESRELPIYALTVAKGGAKLAAAKQLPAVVGQDDPQRPSVVLPPSAEGLRKGVFVQYGGQEAEMTAKGVTPEQLVHWLAGYSEIGGRTVVDQTGLGGAYDFKLRWTRERLAAPSPQSDQSGATPPPEPESPALFTSLSEQLGLRLISTKGPVEVLVIDHIEKPSEN
jgi:bla regulator protein BlaR1